MQSGKPFYLSKTLWINLLMALFAFWPVGGEWIKSNPDMMISAFALINMILRMASKGSLELW